MRATIKIMAATAAVVGMCSLCGAAPVAPAMKTAAPGSVRPSGWLRDRALAAKNGFTGHMEEVDEHFRLAWTTNCMRRGTSLGWENQHNGSWSTEGGAYWFDGLVKLAYQLDDPELKALAKRRLDPLLDNVGPKTVGFVWWLDRTCRDEVEELVSKGPWRFWTAGISERALAAWWEATRDARVPRVLTHVFGFEEMARRMGGTQASLAGAWWDAARVTGSSEVERCLDIACEQLRKTQYANAPWKGLEETLNLRRLHLLTMRVPSRHGVMASEYLLSVFRAYLRTGDEKLRDAVLAWYAFFDRYCRQPYGVTMMDEEWGWAGAKRGTETCDVAAETFTRENLLAALGDGKWGDDIERAVFNAGPACVSRDFKRHVYFQMPNRTGAKGESAAMSCPWDSHLRYGLSVWPLCCTAALNRILPNYVQHLWLVTGDGGVAAALYGPSEFAADLPCGRVAFAEETSYPFDETVTVRVKASPELAFPLKLRLPGWCAKPSVAVNGAPVEAKAERGFVTLNRIWKAGDTVVLRFSMAPRLERWRDMNDFGRARVSLCCGPLLFAYAIPEKNDNEPSVPVVEPLLPTALEVSEIAVTRGLMPSVWDWRVDAPVKLTVPAADGKPLQLVPYGCTKLRISAFGVADR